MRKVLSDILKVSRYDCNVIIFGDTGVGKEKVIDKNTPVSPLNCYGDSKVQAENGIIPLSDEDFKVVILRAPMIYGKELKGDKYEANRNILYTDQYHYPCR